MIRFNEFFEADNIDEAWKYWYDMIVPSDPEREKIVESRDGAVVGEIINATTVIKDPTRCILKSPIRKLPMRYMVGELLWYLSGENTLKSIQTITHAWDRMSDDGETVNSNYGNRIQHMIDEYDGKMFNQMKMVEHMLTVDPLSRQAVIHIKQARDLVVNPTKDVNCTICLQFFIRHDKLYLTTYMRSNDLWMGFPNDVFQFTAMQIYLAMRLGVDLGTYTHHAGSLHLYERDYEKSLENIVAEKFKDGEITAGEYKPQPPLCGE